jgi:single-stranded-DNA-specific exonuclease
VLHSRDWSSGVIGIVASKLIDAYNRPVILLEEGEDLLHGSARSIEAFDLYNALNECAESLETFGGHKMAAGLSLKKDNLEDFLKRLEFICSQVLDDEALLPSMSVDSRVSFEEVNSQLLEIVKKFAPHGAGNPMPIFTTTELLVKTVDLVGANKSHLKMRVQDKNGYSFQTIGFGMGSINLRPGQIVDLAFKLHENEWNGKKSLELMVVDICIKD